MHELVKPEAIMKWLRREAEKNKVRRSEVSAGAHFVARARKLRQSADLIEKQAERIERLRVALAYADLTIRSFPEANQSHFEFVRQALSPTEDE